MLSFVDVSSLVVNEDVVGVVSSLMVLAVDATPGRRCRKSGATPPLFFRFGFVILLVGTMEDDDFEVLSIFCILLL